MADDIRLPGEERFARRPHLQGDEYDTSVLITVASQDRRPPHGTMIAQMILYVDDGYKVRLGQIGKCPHCRRDLKIRLVASRLHA